MDASSGELRNFQKRGSAASRGRRKRRPGQVSSWEKKHGMGCMGCLGWNLEWILQMLPDAPPNGLLTETGVYFFLPWHWRWFSSVAPTRRKTLLSTWSPPSKDQTCSLPFCCAQFCRRIEGSGRTLFPRGPVHIMATHQAWSHVLMGGYLKNLALQSWDLRVSTQVPQNEVVASVSEVNLQAGRGRYELDMGT